MERIGGRLRSDYLVYIKVHRNEDNVPTREVLQMWDFRACEMFTRTEELLGVNPSTMTWEQARMRGMFFLTGLYRAACDLQEILDLMRLLYCPLTAEAIEDLFEHFLERSEHYPEWHRKRPVLLHVLQMQGLQRTYDEGRRPLIRNYLEYQVRIVGDFVARAREAPGIVARFQHAPIACLINAVAGEEFDMPNIAAGEHIDGVWIPAMPDLEALEIVEPYAAKVLCRSLRAMNAMKGRDALLLFENVPPEVRTTTLQGVTPNEPFQIAMSAGRLLKVRSAQGVVEDRLIEQTAEELKDAALGSWPL